MRAYAQDQLREHVYQKAIQIQRDVIEDTNLDNYDVQVRGEIRLLSQGYASALMQGLEALFDERGKPINSLGPILETIFPKSCHWILCDPELKRQFGATPHFLARFAWTMRKNTSCLAALDVVPEKCGTCRKSVNLNASPPVYWSATEICTKYMAAGTKKISVKGRCSRCKNW